VSPESMAEALAARQALRAADMAQPQELARGPEQREFQVGAASGALWGKSCKGRQGMRHY
jgi:hypothetical protein